MSPRIVRGHGHDTLPHSNRVLVIAVAHHRTQRKRHDDDHQYPGFQHSPKSRITHKTPSQNVTREHHQHDQSDERQVHPTFSRHVGDRHDARRGRQNQEKRKPQKTEPRPVAERYKTGYEESRDQRSGQEDRQGRTGHRPPIIQAEPVRPEGQPQIVQDHAPLRSKVVDRRDDLHVESCRRLPRFIMDTDSGQRQPNQRGHERQVEGPTPPHDFRPTIGQEDAIVEQHDQRSGDHHLLGSHPQAACHDRCHVPRPGPRCLRSTHGTIQTDEIEEAHHRFGPLDNVGDTFGPERVDQPNERHSKRQRIGRRCLRRVERHQLQRAAYETEEHKTGH